MKHGRIIFSSFEAIRIALVISLVLASFSALALDSSNQKNKCDSSSRHEEVFIAVEQMPQFRGGETALMKYLQENVIYPEKAVKDSIQGRVVVQFLVDITGEVGEVKIVRSVREDLDEEVVRLVKTLPKFSPGRICGKAVKVWYTLPVTFKLQGVDQSEETINKGNRRNEVISPNHSTDVHEMSMNSKVYAEGQNIIIESPVEQSALICDAIGRARSVKLQIGRNEIPVNAGGLYIVRVREKSVKLMLK